MKRVVKKTIATVLSSAMMFGTMLSGGVAPVFAEVFAPDTEELTFDVLADTQYDDGGVDDSGFFFMQGGKFGEEVDENAVLVVMDENGNKTEIPSKTADGRKFTKAVKATSGSFYNMVALYKGDQCALLRADGTYFGGAEHYYNAKSVRPLSDDIIVVQIDTGKTQEVRHNGTQVESPVYEYKIITATGNEISLGETVTDNKYSNDFYGANIVGDMAIMPAAGVIYNMKTDTLELVSQDTDKRVRVTGGNYYAITDGSSTAVYDGSGNQVMTVPGICSAIDTSVLDTDGYAIITNSTKGNHIENIISRDGTLWNTTDYTGESNIRVEMSVVNAQKAIYEVSIRRKVQTGNGNVNSYTYECSKYLYSRDGSFSMNVQDEIQRLGTQKGYTNISGLYYTMNEDVVINVLDLDNDNSGAVFGYDGANGYQNPTELKGNRVGAVNTAEGYLLTQQRTYTEGDTASVDVRLAGMYNEQYEQTAFTDGADIACKSTYRMYYANEKYVFRIQNTDGTYSLLDKNGNLTGVYSDIYQEKGRIPNNRRHTSEAYISGVNRNAAGAYTTDLYNAQGNKIISDYQGYADIDGTKDYLLVYTRKSIEDDYKAYMICDHNGNVLMTNEQYGLYDFFETDDGALLACVYNTDADGNKKFGAVKIASADIDLDKNGVYIENGEIRYYVNGKVSSDYTGMSVDAEGHKYWFDNGTAAKDKQVYSPADDAWYWFDANGTMAVGKDVFIPKSNDDRSQGKWVRYDENGHMVKGEDYANGGWYRFDEITGEMAKGFYSVEDGEDTKLYYYNKDTGIMEHGAVNIDGTEYAFDDVTGVAVDKAWYSVENAPYWYENGVRQGMEGRGKEIYDPISDGWYWLDAVDGGKKAVSKDVYQESYAGAYADREDGTGKWVRYNAEGRMIKGWSEQNGNRYYFDLETGAMAKGTTTIDGTVYTFSWVTGALQ